MDQLKRISTALFADLLTALRFYSRLPVPVFAFEHAPHTIPDVSRMARVLPLAGLLIAIPAVVVLASARALGVPSFAAAGLALAALVLTTGAFHEDGLADTADGFGGGASRERKLEIMRDSRIGTYGGAALVLSLGLRWSALAAILDLAGSEEACLAMLAAAALSRPLGLLPLYALEPARADGAAYDAGRPSTQAFAIALAGGGLAVAVLGLAFASTGTVLAALVLPCLGAVAVAEIARRQIGGQTGDVAGAAQQIAEILCLLAFCARAPI